MKKAKLEGWRAEGRSIDRLFIDLTFSEPFWDFPSKKSSIDIILHLIASYPSDQQVYLEFDMIGLEELLCAISNTFLTPVPTLSPPLRPPSVTRTNTQLTIRYTLIGISTTFGD
jgi:hypothetical protein